MTQTSSLSLTDPAHRRTAVFCAIVLLLGCVLRIVDLGGIQRRSPDEAMYTSEAHQIASEGVPAVIDRWNRDPSLFLYPTPVRLGFLVPLGWAQAVRGDDSPSTGALLSCLSSMVALALLGIIAWRHLAPRMALYAMLLFAVCPPELMMARRAWMESFTGCFALLLMLLSLEALAQPRARLWAIAAGCCAGWTITIKETSMSHAALLILLLGISLLRQKRWNTLALVLGSAALTAALGALWLSHSFSGFHQVLSFYRRTYAMNAMQPYAVAYQSGSVASWLQCIWIADPLIASLAVAGMLTLFQTRTRLLLWALAVVAFSFGLPLTAAHSFNLRFSGSGFAALCLLAAAGIGAIAGWLRQNLQAGEFLWTHRLAVAVLLCALAINYLSFRERFVQTDLQDLSLRMVLDQSPPL